MGHPSLCSNLRLCQGLLSESEHMHRAPSIQHSHSLVQPSCALLPGQHLLASMCL